jgi:hypothetical protein
MGVGFDNTELSVFFFIDVGCMFISELEAKKDVRGQKYWSTVAISAINTHSLTQSLER